MTPTGTASNAHVVRKVGVDGLLVEFFSACAKILLDRCSKLNLPHWPVAGEGQPALQSSLRGAAQPRKPSAKVNPVKIFRYRKPSLKTILGLTTAKRRVKRSLGISQVEAWTKPSRVRQRVKSKLGLYSPITRGIREIAKGKFPTFLGLFNGKK